MVPGLFKISQQVTASLEKLQLWARFNKASILSAPAENTNTPEERESIQ